MITFSKLAPVFSVPFRKAVCESSLVSTDMRIPCCRTRQDLIVLVSALILLAYCDLVRRLVFEYVHRTYGSAKEYREDPSE